MALGREWQCVASRTRPCTPQFRRTTATRAVPLRRERSLDAARRTEAQEEGATGTRSHLDRGTGPCLRHVVRRVRNGRDDTDANLVRNLRRKLGDDAASPVWIFLERGVGWRIVGPGEAATHEGRTHQARHDGPGPGPALPGPCGSALDLQGRHQVDRSANAQLNWGKFTERLQWGLYYLRK